MSLLTLAPEALGETIREVAADLLAHERKLSQGAALYCEKVGGFQCRTCRHAEAQNATHGRCVIMAGSINLDEGCCVMWAPDTDQLHLYREPQG